MSKNNEVKRENFFLRFLKTFIWLAVILFAVDLLTKILAYYLLPYETPVPINGFEWLAQLTLTFNTGAAFGIGKNIKIIQILFCLFSYAVAIIIIVYYIKKYKNLSTFLKITLMIVLAGDLGNLVDRTFALFNNLPTIYQNGVIDFVDISPIIPGFGIFNFADACLCIGIAMLFIYLIFDLSKKEK